MDTTTLKEILSSISEWNSDFLEYLKSQSEKLEKSAKKYSTFSPIILRSLLLGFLGFAFGILAGFLLGFYFNISPYMLMAILSFIFAPIGLLYGYYTGKGGKSALDFSNIIQNFDDELRKLEKDIKQVKKAGASEKIIAELWADHERLRKMRTNTVKAKASMDLKKMDKNLEKKVEDSNDELILRPLNEMKAELDKIKEKIELSNNNK